VAYLRHPSTIVLLVLVPLDVRCSSLYLQWRGRVLRSLFCFYAVMRFSTRHFLAYLVLPVPGSVLPGRTADEAGGIRVDADAAAC